MMAVIDPECCCRRLCDRRLPMSEPARREEVFWVEPKRRAIIPLDGLPASPTRSGRRSARPLRRSPPTRRSTRSIRRCADARGDLDQQRDRGELHPRSTRLGLAHSIECWHGERAGRRPLRGRIRPRLFRREHVLGRARRLEGRARLAGRAAEGRRLPLLDCQFMTDHLRSLGAVEISQKDYLACWPTRCRRRRRRGGAPEWRVAAAPPRRACGAASSARSTGCSAAAGRHRRRSSPGMLHRAALGPDVVDRMLDDVERRRLLVEPAEKTRRKRPAVVRLLDVELDEGAGELLRLPGARSSRRRAAARSRRRPAPPGQASASGPATGRCAC